MKRLLLLAFLSSITPAAWAGESYEPIIDVHVLGGEVAQQWLDRTDDALLAVTDQDGRIIVLVADPKLQTGASPPDTIYAGSAPAECSQRSEPVCCADDRQWLKHKDGWINTNLMCSAFARGKELPAPSPIDPPLSHVIKEIVGRFDESLLAVPFPTRFYITTAPNTTSCVYSLRTCRSSSTGGDWACVGSPGKTGKLYKKQDCRGDSDKEWWKWASCKCDS